MSIPTGADLYILKAKSQAQEVVARCSNLQDMQLATAILDLIKALELIQRERQQEKGE